MVLYVVKWDIHPDKGEAYLAWYRGAIQRTLEAPGGPVEFRAYRPATGETQVLATFEFPDLTAWAAWYSQEDVQKVMDELRTMASKVTTELWGPSPLVPAPVRPGR